MTKYEVVKDEQLGTEVIKRTDIDGNVWWIPKDQTNSDYQAYLNKDKPKVEHLTEIIPADEA